MQQSRIQLRSLTIVIQVKWAPISFHLQWKALCSFTFPISAEIWFKRRWCVMVGERDSRFCRLHWFWAHVFTKFFFFFGGGVLQRAVAWYGISVPRREIEPRLQWWNHWILTIRQPGSSLLLLNSHLSFLNWFSSPPQPVILSPHSILVLKSTYHQFFIYFIF